MKTEKVKVINKLQDIINKIITDETSRLPFTATSTKNFVIYILP
jgi:hypothetical protein